jgi:hypothetical protein
LGGFADYWPIQCRWSATCWPNMSRHLQNPLCSQSSGYPCPHHAQLCSEVRVSYNSPAFHVPLIIFLPSCYMWAKELWKVHRITTLVLFVP